MSLHEGPISADLYGPADQDLRSHGVLAVIDRERVSDGITTRRGGAKSSLSGPCYLEGSLGTSINGGGMMNRPEGAGSKASSLRQPDRPLREAIFRPLVTSRRNWRAWKGVVYTD